MYRDSSLVGSSFTSRNFCDLQPINLSLLADRLNTRRLTSIRPGQRWIAMSSSL